MSDTAAALVSRLSHVGALNETTKGTNVLSSITAGWANATFYDSSIEPESFFSDTERMPIGSFNDELVASVGKQAGRFSFQMEMTAYTTAASNPLLLLTTLAGMSVASTVATPTSSISTQKTYSLKLWEAGRLKALYGAMGDLTLDLEYGKKAMATFAGMGCWSAVTDATLPSTAAGSLPWVCTGMTLTVGGAEIGACSKVQVKLNNQVSMCEDVTGATGYRYAFIGSRKPTISIDPEARLVATLDHYGLLLAGTSAAVSIALTNGTRTLTIAAPVAQRRNISNGDRGGRRIDNIELVCCRSSGDDEISFTFG